MGICYNNGQGVPQDYALAVAWYRKAAEQGHAAAQNNLANCYYNGQGVAQDYVEAASWYRKAAEQGNTDAQNSLGNRYYWGEGVQQDYALAVAWYRKAAEQGHAAAQNNLANCYYNGQGVAQNYDEAVRWYTKAAEQSHAWGQNSLGNRYYWGEGVQQDYALAVAWYRKAAEQGHAAAQNNLANCYYNGRGVPQDYVKAASWYRKAAEQGNTDAQNSLGDCYYFGRGVAQDYAEAVDWYRVAAEQGCAWAQYNLGICYNNGQGVPQDYVEAASWYRKAAEQGHAEAQYNLGEYYRYGNGVATDLQEAVDWYTRSAEQGKPEAKQALEGIENSDSAEAIEQTAAEPVSAAPAQAEGGSLEELMAQLEGMTGLAEVKRQVKEQVAQIDLRRRAREKGILTDNAAQTFSHMVFTGNPGTGKTTVARLIGKIYGALGVLPKSDVFVECSRKDLVSEYIGQTSKLVQNKVEEAMGGILFIDEAYSLYKDDDPRDFGKEAINTLIQSMENNRSNLLVILAGYTEQMHHMLNHANSGLKSRVPVEIRFDDYTPEEMLSIFESMLDKQGRHLSPEAREEVKNLLIMRAKDPSFGNARGVRNVMESVLGKQELRLAEMEDFSAADYCTVLSEDVLSAIHAGKVPGRKSSLELLNELNQMVGLDKAKAEVQKRVKSLQLMQMAKKVGLSLKTTAVPPHLLFTGNPGTGKTTVARLIGKIYGALGVLPRGDVFVECSRKDLVGTHVGETAPMVQKKVQEALGGILFIDEAYSLFKADSGSDFGREAIDTLIQCMENNRGNLVVILAGYTKEMHDMLRQANPGLASRIGTVIEFEDYTVPELCQIFRAMLKERGLHLPEDVDDALLMELLTVCSAAKDFGNARGVRNTLDKVVDAQNDRLFEQSMDGATLTKDDFVTIRAQDVQTVLAAMKV